MGGTLMRYEPSDQLMPARPHQGPIQAMFTRARASRSAATMEALVPLAEAHTQLTTAHTAFVEARHKDFEAMCRENEAPEKFGRELAVRRAQHVEEMRQLQHRYEANELIREREITERQTALNHARIALADSEQQLQAQNEHGYLKYVLAHKRQALEILEVELNQAERRSLFKEHEQQSYGRSTAVFDENVIEALLHQRAQMNAAGLPTAAIDAALRELKR